VNIDNFIIIKGGLCNDIKKALQQWIALYAKDLVSNIKLELYILGQERYLIVADKRLSNEKFNYLINYLRYPEGIEYNISIEGYATVRDEKIYPQKLLNKKILVYVSGNDKEYDNVFVTTEDNETYKIDFNGKVSRVYESKTFSIPDIDTKLLQEPERITLTKKEIAEIKNEKSKKSVRNRFRIILALVIIIAAINSFSLFIYPDNDISSFTTFILVFFVAFWFDWDYKMLRIDKYYRYSIIIALLHLAYGHFIRKYLSDEDSFLYYGFYFPVLYLIIQKPVRLFFIRKFNREPIVEPHPPLLDGLYSITILFLTVGIISIIAMFT
jgi:hypothetical protein